MTDGEQGVPGCSTEGVPDSSKESAVTFVLERFDRLFRKSASCTFETVEAGVEIDKRELEAQRCRQGFEYAASSLWKEISQSQLEWKQSRVLV